MAKQSKKSTFIRTFTKRKFYPFNPQEKDIDIEDIAHSLSVKCRFAGMTKDLYSVAQHSVIVSSMLKDEDYGLSDEELEENRQLQLAGLLHDAAEAYTFDCPGPILQHFVEFRDLQDNILIQVAKKFGLTDKMLPFCDAVHFADMRALVTESRDLDIDIELARDQIVKYSSYSSLTIVPWGNKYAKEMFLSTFENLVRPIKTLFED